VEWPDKRCYVGLVAVGIQEQAEDILVPPLLRNCLTLMTFPFLVIISPRTVVLAIVFTYWEKFHLVELNILIQKENNFLVGFVLIVFTV